MNFVIWLLKAVLFAAVVKKAVETKKTEKPIISEKIDDGFMNLNFTCVFCDGIITAKCQRHQSNVQSWQTGSVNVTCPYCSGTNNVKFDGVGNVLARKKRPYSYEPSDN